MKIEDHPAFAEKLPHICYVLGGEKTPLKIGERFRVKGYGMECWINEEFILDADICAGNCILKSVIYEAINHPEKIIRHPQFSEDEKALMRLYVKAGYPTFVRGEMRGEDNQLMVYCKTDHEGFYLPEKVLPQITIQNSPFDASAYLESEKKQ